MLSKINRESTRAFLGISLAVVTQYAPLSMPKTSVACMNAQRIPSKQKQR